MWLGGTGITPMIQLMNNIFNGDDETKVNLLFANRSEQDIFLKSHLDNISKVHGDRLKVTYIVDEAPENGWNGETGFVTREMIKKYLPAPTTDTMIFVCGPDPMYKSICGLKAEDKSQGELDGVLKQLGYTSDNVYKF